MAPRFSIVLPAYCEAQTLPDSLATIRATVEPLGAAEFIVVDDGSPDDTWTVLCDLVRVWPDLRALRLSRNFGKESALSAGMSQAKGEAVIIMDADLQHPPELIPEMIRLWAEDGFDVVNTVKRRRESEGPAKLWLTRLYFGLFSTLAGIDVDNASDFKLLDRRVVDSLNDLPERLRYFRGLVAWIGYRQATLPFDVPPRRGGQTSWSLWKRMSLGLSSIVGFSALPMHLMTVLGLVFGGLSVFLTARTLWLWLIGEAVPGFTTVILLLIVIGSILMTGLGIIGAYIAKIYDEVKSRPGFIIQESLMGEVPEDLQTGKGRTGQSKPVPVKKP